MFLSFLMAVWIMDAINAYLRKKMVVQNKEYDSWYQFV